MIEEGAYIRCGNCGNHMKVPADAAGLMVGPVSYCGQCARSKGPGGFFKDLLGALGLLTVMATAWTVAESLDTPAPEPECRKQWTSDSRYVRHCNFHNGRGWVVTP